MLKIRFQRTGRRNDPAYRIVVAEHTASPRAGRNVAVVGSYHPKTKQTSIDAEAVKKWLGHGAQASGTVHNLLISQGIIEGKKMNVLPKKTPIVKEKEEVEEEAAADTAEPEAPAEASEDAPEEESTPVAEEEVEEKKEEAAPEEAESPEDAEKTAS